MLFSGARCGELFRIQVFEVGTHSPWVQEVIGGCGHEVLVANPWMMDGSIRRKRKNDRIDANKLARLGRVDPQSLHPIRHRSREVRQDLAVLRARDALVAARTELINATDKRGDAVGRPSCQSSHLSDPNANFSVEMCRKSNVGGSRAGGRLLGTEGTTRRLTLPNGFWGRYGHDYRTRIGLSSVQNRVISSSDRPLVSGISQATRMTVDKAPALKSQKVPANPKCFCMIGKD